AALGAQLLALPGAEAMLLVHHRKSELRELDLLLDERVGADYERAVARRGSGADTAPLRRALAADEKLDRQAGKARFEVGAKLAEVLARQDLGRGHHDRLQPGRVCHRHARGSNRRLARAHVPVQQPVHGRWALHVLESRPWGRALGAGSLEASGGLERVRPLM